jgi:hypothetical protein
MTDANAQKTTVRAGDGVMSVMVTVAGDLTEHGLAGSLGIMKALRANLFRVAQGGVEWAQSVEQVPFAVIRDVIQSADKISLEVIEGLEAIALTTTRALRRSGEAAVALVARTSESLVASKERSERAA